MKTLLTITFLLLAVTASARADSGDLKITPASLSFRYIGSDGATTLHCTEKLENELSHDWRVLCSDGKGMSRNYLVHLWVSRYEHEDAAPGTPRLSYEVLYWTTDETLPTQIVTNHTTVWFHFNQLSDLNTIDINQAVDHDEAELNMVIRASAK